jgi:hypothetical protein
LNCERLEDRVTPATYAVKLCGPPEGITGDTAATISGTLSQSSVWPVDGGGASLIEASSAADAISRVLTGTITVTVGSASYLYSTSYPPGSVGSTQAAHKPFWYDGFVLRLEDTASATTSDWDYNDRTWQVSALVHIPATATPDGPGGEPPSPAPADLDFIDSTGTAVAEDKETSVGGYVPMNNDNDNYNFPSATSLAHIVDSSETAQVVGESDLVEIKVTVPSTGNYRLRLLNQYGTTVYGYRVWSSADKVGQVQNDAPMTSTRSLWVEGLGISSNPRDQIIQLVKLDQLNMPTVIDTVRFTLYEVSGAMNVPGYSKHVYEAVVAGGAPRFEGVAAVTSVTAGGLVYESNFTRVSRRADVLWEGGAAVGKYRVYPTAANNFFVDREVNVVKVEITAAEGADNKIKHDGVPEQEIHPVYPHLSFTILSAASGSLAMEALLTIKKIEGPVAGGVMRGVKFIESGFIQSVEREKHHAKYTGKRRVFAMEGQIHLDGDPDQNAKPWYDYEGNSPYAEGANLPPDARGAYKAETDPQPGNPLTNVKLHVADTPQQPGTDSMHLANIPGNPDDGKPVMPQHQPNVIVNRYEIVLKFMLYFAVRTREAVLGSDTVYTQRGSAWWKFNGSGEMSQYIWTPDMGAGNSGPSVFTEVTNGAVVPITTGRYSNEISDELLGSNPPTPPWVTVQ